VLTALKALGINVTYQTAQTTTTGVIAPALTFAFTVPSLPQNSYFNGPTGVSFTLGRTTASVTLHPVLDTGGGSFGNSPVGSTGQNGPPNTTSSLGGSPSLAGGVLGSKLPNLGSGTGTGTGITTAPIASGGQPQATTPNLRLTPVALVDRSQADLSGLYLIAVAVAVVALAAASILRLLGVRLLWGS
jgi:hypothetical protein